MDRGRGNGCIIMPTSMNTGTDISTITGTIMVGTIITNTVTNTIIKTRVRSRFGALRKRASRGRMRLLVLVSAVILLAPISPAKSQSSKDTIENEYRECVYAKSRSGRYVHGERDSDFGLIGECRNQWVAYMDVCAKMGFDNATCVMKSRLIIHAILNLTGK